MTTPRLAVLGSINVDHIMNIAQFPTQAINVISAPLRPQATA